MSLYCLTIFETGSSPRDRGVSKRIENHGAAVALYFMYYSFGRVHQTPGVIPAMEAGLTDRVWTIQGIV
jgi:hypothetical protein